MFDKKKRLFFYSANIYSGTELFHPLAITDGETTMSQEQLKEEIKKQVIGIQNPTVHLIAYNVIG